LKKKGRKLKGIVLPVSFTLQDDTVRRIGEATLSGLELSFKKSPIGLETVDLTVVEDDLWLTIQTGFYSSAVESVVERTFNQIREIGALFVEEGHSREQTDADA
jgi:hypothetical protein